ncbi:MAG: PAS domain S-box protein, partial [Methylobacterium sp.]
MVRSRGVPGPFPAEGPHDPPPLSQRQSRARFTGPPRPGDQPRPPRADRPRRVRAAGGGARRDARTLSVDATGTDMLLRRARALEEEAAGLRARAATTGTGGAPPIPDGAARFAAIALDRDGCITAWNAGAEDILGWTAEAMGGQPFAALFTPEDRAAGHPGAALRRALDEGGVADADWHLRAVGGRRRMSGSVTPLRDGAGAHVGYVAVLQDSLDLDTADRALREAEARLLRAQEAGGIGLFTVGVDDGLLHPTPQFCRLYGLPERSTYPAEIVEALILPEDQTLVSTAASRRRGDAPRDVTYRIRRPDTGEIRWIARQGEIERDVHGRPVRFSGVARDITEQRQARDALRAGEERYRTLFDAIDDGFCIIEFFDGPHGPLSDYVHIEANPGYERHTGIPNIVGRTLRGLVAAEDADAWLDLYGGVLRTGRPIRFERFFAQADRFIDVSAARVEPPGRRQVSVLFRDVTARRQAEDALRASEALARTNIQRVQLALAAGAIIGTWFWDLPSDRFTVDEAFARSFGLDPALGREGLSLAQVVETVHPDDRDGLAEAITAAIARGGAYAHQYRVRRADGNYYWLEANGRVDHAPDGTPLSFPGVLIDVDERKAVEAERDRVTAALRSLNETLEQRVAARSAELMRAEEALRQSQKMEAVGQLTGGLAHDFNNMLAGIVGSLELMQTRMLQGRVGDLDRYIGAAQGAAKRAAALTHRLLAFSRRQTLDPKPTDVNRLVEGMMDLVRRTVGPAVAIESVGAGGLWPTLVDPSQLENALLNLCINARDAMPEGGRIVIETANRWLDHRAAQERELEPGQYVTLCVSDNGTGMTPDVVAKAFDPFFTTKP